MSYLPQTGKIDIEELTKTVPSYTYRFDFENKRIIGKVDGQEAVVQAIHKVFETMRYAYVIYDSRYGEEFTTLIGKSYPYAAAAISSMVEDCLMQDDRILHVFDFVTEKKDADTMYVEFKVDTVYGEIVYSTEVSLR